MNRSRTLLHTLSVVGLLSVALAQEARAATIVDLVSGNSGSSNGAIYVTVDA